MSEMCIRKPVNMLKTWVSHSNQSSPQPLLFLLGLCLNKRVPSPSWFWLCDTGTFHHLKFYCVPSYLLYNLNMISYMFVLILCQRIDFSVWDWCPGSCKKNYLLKNTSLGLWPTLLVYSFQGIWPFALNWTGSNLRTASQCADSCSCGCCWSQWSHVGWAILLVYLDLKCFLRWESFSSWCQLNQEKSQKKQNKLISLVSFYLQPKTSSPPHCIIKFPVLSSCSKPIMCLILCCELHFFSK